MHRSERVERTMRAALNVDAGGGLHHRLSSCVLPKTTSCEGLLNGVIVLKGRHYAKFGCYQTAHRILIPARIGSLNE